MGSIAIKNALRKCREHKHEEYYSGKDKDGYSEYIKKHGYHLQIAWLSMRFVIW